jgi:phage gpG-like protein
MNVYCQLDPNSPGLKLLLEIQRRMADKPLTLKKLAVMMRSSVIKNFEAEGRPSWVKRTVERPWKILNRHGGAGLLGSIRPRVTGEYAEVWTNKAYAAAHNYGHTYPARTIMPKNKKALFWPGAAHPVKSVKWPGATLPKREFMCIPNDEQVDMGLTLLGYVATGIWKKVAKVIRL